MTDSIENWIQLAIEHLPAGIIVIDRSGNIKVFNQKLAELTKINPLKVLDLQLVKIFNSLNIHENKLLQTITLGIEFKGLPPQSLIPTIDSLDYKGNTYTIKDASGVTNGAMAVLVPVGKQRELEEAVIKAEKLAILGQLAASAAHEIKNPLTTISGFLQLMSKDLQGTPKEEYLNIMLSELKHVNKLVSEILQLAKPGSSKRMLCDINKSVTEIYKFVESEASMHSVNIYLETADDVPVIYADCEQIKQVILNTIKNAFDALSPEGKIIIQTLWNQKNGIIHIIIHDTGVGIEEETLSCMFDPFFTTKESGTGLGMFISKKIIDNHGGSIIVDSEKGKGTTVTIQLPAN